MSAAAASTPTPDQADEPVCWYADADRRPAMSRCPSSCNGAPTHAERQADGAQRFYCEAHAYWRASEVGKDHLRVLRQGEQA